MSVTSYDSTNVHRFATEGDAITEVIKVDKIVWFGASSGASLLITNTVGDTIFQTVASVNNYSETIDINKKMTGIIILTMNSGTVHIHGRKIG